MLVQATVYVSPPDSPQWFSVHVDGISSAQGFDGRSIHSAPDDVRVDSYDLLNIPSPLWRLATLSEVSAALLVAMLGDDLGD